MLSIAMNWKLSLSIIPEKLGICHLEKNKKIPERALNEWFLSISRTNDELSIVCREEIIPANIKVEKTRKGIKVIGTLDFSLTGILSSLATPLAKAKISIFAISTFNTDYILVKEEKLESAMKVLSKFCHIQH